MQKIKISVKEEKVKELVPIWTVKIALEEDEKEIDACTFTSGTRAAIVGFLTSVKAISDLLKIESLQDLKELIPVQEHEISIHITKCRVGTIPPAGIVPEKV